MADDPVVIDADGTPVDPDLVVRAYRARCFPMADHRGGAIRWYRPARRAVITPATWRVPRSLAKVARRRPYALSIDRAFDAVIAACAERGDTWIGRDVESLFRALHARGRAHSVEAWDAAGALVGGLYGLRLGGCFCGESMFHRASDAAKLCVVHLAERLWANGFGLLDCQQQTPHMERFGAVEIDDEEYARLLERHAAERPFP